MSGRQSEQVEELLRDIAIRGGPAHWTHDLIDEVMGPGWSAAVLKAHHAEEARQKARERHARRRGATP